MDTTGKTTGSGRRLTRLAIVATVRMALSFALTFALVSLARLAACAITGSAFGARYVLAMTVCAWIALRALEVTRMTMPLEYGSRSWPVRVLNWAASIVFLLAMLVLFDFIFD